MCTRVGVLYAGRLVEEGPVETVLQDPRHPYTVGLLRCIPRGGVRKDRGRLDTIPGSCRASARSIPGCVFADRCALADERCRQRGAAADRRRERPREPLLVPRACARAPARGGCAISSCRRSTAAATATRRRRRADEGLPPARTRRPRARPRSARRSGRARRWASSASPAAARRRSRERCSASSRRRPERRSSKARSCRPATRSARADELRALQIVFQNPDSALNRRHSVRRILLRSLKKLAGLSGSAAERADARPDRARAPHRARRSRRSPCSSRAG